jgi:hypothetical protein
LLVVAALLRFSPLPLFGAPSGADMSMHTVLARYIADADGWPHSQRPYLPVDTFGSYPLGFHALVGIGVRLGGDVLRTPLFAACAAQAIVIGALFLAIRRFGFDNAPAAAATCIGLYCCSVPQTALAWGGAPTVLSYALLFGAAGLVPTKKASAMRIVVLGLVAAGAAATHLIPVAIGAYVLGAGALALAVFERSSPSFRVVVVGSLSAALIAAVLLLPYIFGGIVDISPFEHQWVRELITNEHQKIFRVPLLFNTIGVFIPALAIAGFALQHRRHPALAYAAAACVGAMLICYASTYSFFLPLSELLYPTRLPWVLHLPMGIGVAALWNAIASRRTLAFSTAAVLGLFGLGMHVHEYHLGAAEDVVITRDDRILLQWIEEHVPEDAIIANNYGDAGLWIPAVARRAITRPHMNPFYFTEFLTERRDQRVAWIYVGEKATYPHQPRPWDRARLEHDPRFRLVRAEGGAAVFQVVGEPIAVPADVGDPS